MLGSVNLVNSVNISTIKKSVQKAFVKAENVSLDTLKVANLGMNVNSSNLNLVFIITNIPRLFRVLEHSINSRMK